MYKTKGDFGACNLGVSTSVLPVCLDRLHCESLQFIIHLLRCLCVDLWDGGASDS